MYDLIIKKRNGQTLEGPELEYMVNAYVKGEVPDYQMSAMLMAIYFRGMEDRETAILTNAMARSGDIADLSSVKGVKVDKHSTGGVGDKTTLIAAPIAAACGLKVAKMSGRGLGHTGGTVDKLESIPGLRTSFDRQEFSDIVNETGICLAGQSGNLAPADKKLYALRDVTGTVESIPLIAASIMSKKLAAGSDCIVLDVKTGSGAFMKTIEEAGKLAEKMIAIGEHAGKRMAALITNMDLPLGNYIGNALEVEEAVAVLKGEGPEDLTEVCLELAGTMLYLAGDGTREDCVHRARTVLERGAALEKFAEMVQAQGGTPEVIHDPSLLKRSPVERKINAGTTGYITHMNTEAVGMAAALLGAGRTEKESPIDFGAGIILLKKTGDFVREREPIARFFTSKESLIGEAEQVFLDAVEIRETKAKEEKLILSRIGC